MSWCDFYILKPCSLSCVCITREGKASDVWSALDAAWMQLNRNRARKWVPQRSRGNGRHAEEGVGGGHICQWSNHSWINSLLFGLATLIRTLTPCGLQISNLGAGEPKGIHIGELHQQGRITLYQIKSTIIHVQSCCIIKASVLFFMTRSIMGMSFLLGL